MQHVKLIAKILLIVGGINWGLVGLLNMNVVEMLLGSMPMLVKIVYILVGVSGVYSLVLLKDCVKGGGS
jgi:uncharacterized membrane protein YuzA (DUF378 family)